ncbi:MAG: CcmD family protein [Actinomycetota bacterium]
MSDTSWLFVAFTAMWAGIGLYLLSLGARQRKLEARIEQLAGAAPREHE